jgi:hypothetical protein
MAAKMVGPAYVVVADGVAAGVGGADIMSMRQAIGVGVDVVGFVAVGGILYVAMLADEEVMRLNLVVSALVAPKSLVALHGVVGEGDANCVEVVLTIDVVDEGVVVGVGGTGHMVMLQACDAGVDVPNSILVMVTIVGFVRG